MNALVCSEHNWNKYNDYINWEFLKSNYPELYKLYRTVESIYNSRSDSSTKQNDIPSEGRGIGKYSLELGFRTNYPNADIHAVLRIIEQIYAEEVEETLLSDFLTAIRLRESAAGLATTALQYADGDGDVDKLQLRINSFQAIYENTANKALQSSLEDKVTIDLEELLNQEVKNSGLRWRLKSLNKNLGSLRIGDFGWIFARPETGKTTFIASEATFMAQQASKKHPVLWFNNEDRGSKVMVRAYQAHFGVTVEELYKNVASYKTRFADELGEHLVLIDDESPRARNIEAKIQQYSPSLVIIDQLDKVGGFSADRSDLELAAIYKWARSLAKQYCPIIGVCQAGATGDGRKWLTMNDVDNSKTGKQAEADWILGIGKTYDSGLEGVRYFHLCKNKLMGDEDHDPTMRHGKWEVKINQEIARYEDF